LASILKTATGYRAFIRLKVGDNKYSESQAFRTSREANAWAAARETELRALGKKPLSEVKTLRDALERYRDHVTPTKRGQRWESIRLDKFINDFDFIDKPLAQCVPDLFGEWRDKRLKADIKPNTIIREFGLLSAVFETARKEWRWVDSNPISDVRRPSAPAHRDRVITRREIKTLLRHMGYTPRGVVKTKAQCIAVAFLVALRTGMRQKELCTLNWLNVYGNYCRLPITKTVARDVPFTTKTLRLIAKVKALHADSVFGVKTDVLSTLFRRYRDDAGLSGFTFHDARHTAATWMAPRTDLLTLCKIFGWADPKHAMIYYNPKASDIAERLNKGR